MTTSRITSVCYHYLKRTDEFVRIWGHDLELFKAHIGFFKKRYPPISVAQLLSGLEGKEALPPECSLITFDDCLKEHSDIIGPYLAEQGIQALFNVCADVVVRRLPVIPQILHFGTAYYGVREFTRRIGRYTEKSPLATSYAEFLSSTESMSVLGANKALKDFFNKTGDHRARLELMRAVWNHELEKPVPDIFDRVFMDAGDLKRLIGLGHIIGLHTASHAQVSDSRMSPEFFNSEIMSAKYELEDVIGPVNCFAYPFGHVSDSLSEGPHREKLAGAGFDVILTTFFDGQISFNQHSFGRYLVQSQDSVGMLESRLWTYEIGNPHQQSRTP